MGIVPYCSRCDYEYRPRAVDIVAANGGQDREPPKRVDSSLVAGAFCFVSSPAAKSNSLIPVLYLFQTCQNTQAVHGSGHTSRVYNRVGSGEDDLARPVRFRPDPTREMNPTRGSGRWIGSGHDPRRALQNTTTPLEHMDMPAIFWRHNFYFLFWCLHVTFFCFALSSLTELIPAIYVHTAANYTQYY